MRLLPAPNHDTPPSNTVTHFTGCSQDQNTLRHYRPQGVTYYFGHQISEVEAVFGHHRAQDLGDWFGWFGL